MSDAWIPVFFALVIVIGVVGGSVAQMVLKELLPLLRRIAEQRQAAPPAELQQLSAELGTLQQKLVALEADQRAVREEAEFVRRLLAERSDGPAGRSRPDR